LKDTRPKRNPRPLYFPPFLKYSALRCSPGEKVRQVQCHPLVFSYANLKVYDAVRDKFLFYLGHIDPAAFFGADHRISIDNVIWFDDAPKQTTPTFFLIPLIRLSSLSHSVIYSFIQRNELNGGGSPEESFSLSLRWKCKRKRPKDQVGRVHSF
jgi:hypothetical protein